MQETVERPVRKRTVSEGLGERDAKSIILCVHLMFKLDSVSPDVQHSAVIGRPCNASACRLVRVL